MLSLAATDDAVQYAVNLVVCMNGVVFAMEHLSHKEVSIIDSLGGRLWKTFVVVQSLSGSIHCFLAQEILTYCSNLAKAEVWEEEKGGEEKDDCCLQAEAET